MTAQIPESKNGAECQTLLEFRNVTKVYGEGEAAVRALAGVGFTSGKASLSRSWATADRASLPP